MKCPKCDAEMNLHAEKIIYGPSSGDETDVRAGALLEFHVCPKCGSAGTRDVGKLDY